jgi:hypothetical protein
MAGTSPEAHPLHASLHLSFSDEARSLIAASSPVEVTATRSSLLDFARHPALWNWEIMIDGASLTGFSRATRLGSPIRWVAGSRRDRRDRRAAP